MGFFAWLPDSGRVAIGGVGVKGIWALDQDQFKDLPSMAPVHRIAVSPDGSEVALSSDDKIVHLWDVGASKWRMLSGHTAPVVAMTWSPDGKKLITVDDSLRSWNPATGDPIQTVKITAGVPAAFSPDQSKIAVLNRGRGICVLDCATGAEVQVLESSVSTTRLAWSPDGTKIAAGGFDRHFRAWNVADGKKLHAVTWGEEDIPTAVAWSPDGSKIAVTHQKPAYLVRVLDAASGTVLHSLPAEVGGESDVRWSPDGSKLASGTWNGTLLIWSAADGASLASLPIPGSVTGGGTVLSWSPDGTKIVFGNGGGQVLVASEVAQ
jgi:WD40 repeat protein